jgi:hypothetical protein
MDGQRFDALAKAIATRKTGRRSILQGAAATLFGALAGLKGSRGSHAAVALTAAEQTASDCAGAGRCLVCDPATGQGFRGCVPCDDPCLAFTTATAAGADPTFKRLAGELAQRGYRRTHEAETIVIPDTGTTYGVVYHELKSPHRHAILAYIPGAAPNQTATVLVLRNHKVDSAFGLAADGSLEEHPASNVAAFSGRGGVRALPAAEVSAVWDPVECGKCYQTCDDVNSSAGNAVICTLAGAGICAASKNAVVTLGCGVAAAAACNYGGADCSHVLCELGKGCPRECDPACENRDPVSGTCSDLCTQPNTHCLNRSCVCVEVTCGATCCAPGEVCKEGSCVGNCGPCWFPDNEGQCFDVCAGNFGAQGGTCCVGSQAPNGVCCPAGQDCCDGACIDTGSDPSNCGFCSHVCAAGETCSGGECQCGGAVCDPGVCCNGDCCETVCVGDQCCPDDQFCIDGSCCPSGQPCCNDGCCDGVCSSDGNCCPAARVCEDRCCGAHEECCPDGACRARGTCCHDADKCGEICCKASQTCCNDACCDTICDSDGSCCPQEQSCGAACCAEVQTCCGETCCDGRCDDSGNACCSDADVCGDFCCGFGTHCCDGHCIPLHRQCCTSDQTMCGDACCDGPCDTSGQACCPAEELCADACCGVADICCNGHCIPAHQTCCPEDQTVCGSACCDGPCTESGDACCAAELQCEDRCCADGEECCPDGSCQSQGECCSAEQTLCGGQCCDDATQQCCQGACIDADAFCCDPGESVCGSICCPTTDCCNGGAECCDPDEGNVCTDCGCLRSDWQCCSNGVCPKEAGGIALVCAGACVCCPEGMSCDESGAFPACT